MPVDPKLMDTRHLRILAQILQERSISKAAQKLRMSQPAVSTALKELRTVLNDQLVIVSGKKLILTERAEHLSERVYEVLRTLESLGDHQIFDASKFSQSFRIASPDNLSPIFLTKLFGVLQRQAPGAQFEFNSFWPDINPLQALEGGRYDVVLGNWSELPEKLRCSALYEDDMVCLLRKGHPLTQKPMTAKDYLSAGHIAPNYYSVGKRGVVDSFLMAHRLKRKVVVQVPFFNHAPYALLETDLIFTVNRRLAQHFVTYLPLSIVPSPLPFPKITYNQLWHERTHKSPSCIWLRQQIQQLGESI